MPSTASSRRSWPTPSATNGTAIGSMRSKAHPLRTGLIALALATLPALLLIWLVFWFMGRERRTGYDREYEQEPPTDTEPALVPTLLRQGGEAGSYEFTATLFDLIRRGVYKAEHDHDGAIDLGGAAHRDDLRPRDLRRRGPRASQLGARRRERRGRRARRRVRAALALPRPDRGRARVDAHALLVVQGAVGGGDGSPEVVPLDGRAPSRRGRRPLRARGRRCSSSWASGTGAPCIRATRTSCSSASAHA